jgi:hypothetical protein
MIIEVIAVIVAIKIILIDCVYGHYDKKTCAVCVNLPIQAVIWITYIVLNIILVVVNYSYYLVITYCENRDNYDNYDNYGSLDDYDN